MSQRVRIRAGSVSVDARLDDTPTGRRIAAALPLEGRVRRWGEEIYFETAVEDELAEGAREEMAVGELAYWPPGRALCIFFGPTPASHGEEPRAASPVNPVGRIEGDATSLASVPDGAAIVVEPA